jgi:uncharacterized membrane protein
MGGAGPIALASFLASLVECVEALTVVLAVGAVRGWRWPLAGTGSALAVLAAITLVFWPVLALVPLPLLRLGVGTLLLLFGLRWLRKAILRAAGRLPPHDEAAVFAAETAAIRRVRPGTAGRPDWVAFGAGFQIVMLEGIEIVFIVVAVGTGGYYGQAAAGALAALAMVVLLGAAVHRPLARVPENALKFSVGVVLAAFGTYWTGEGIGADWPGGDWSVPGLVLAFLVVSLAAVSWCRNQGPAA